MPDLFMDSPQGQQFYDFTRMQTSANNAFSAEQAEKQMQFQTAANAKMMDFEHKEAELNRDWQEMLSNTAYQRQVKDMLAAGLNPVLGIANSGASVPSGATGRGATSSGSKAEPDTSINGAMSNFVSALINGETQRIVADTHAAATMEAAKTSAEASRYGSELAASASMYGSQQMASASRYAASVTAAASRYATDWQREYAERYNPMSIGIGLLQYLTGDDNANLTDLAKYGFEAIFGKTGIAVTPKAGKSFHVGTLDKLKNVWHALTDPSKEYIEALIYNYQYGKFPDASTQKRKK